ncbi:MAG: MSMEG_1061 family FMN-dependent PPOX-type flavoprotein [Ilumatobacteraceae bacterium]
MTTTTTTTTVPASGTIAPPFRHTVPDLAGLRELYREPGKLVANKKTNRIAEPTAAFIAASPMLFMATSDREGRTTVSPRGGVPGFVAVLDERRIAFADVIGNNLIDSLTHIVDNPHVGLLFVIPGRHETLRVEGNAWVTTDPDVLAVVGEPEGKPPKVAVGVEVTSAFIHCSRSFERGHVWDPETWAALVGPSAMELFHCHLADNLPADEMPGAPSEG